MTAAERFGIAVALRQIGGAGLRSEHWFVLPDESAALGFRRGHVASVRRGGVA